MMNKKKQHGFLKLQNEKTYDTHFNNWMLMVSIFNQKDIDYI